MYNYHQVLEHDIITLTPVLSNENLCQDYPNVKCLEYSTRILHASTNKSFDSKWAWSIRKYRYSS